MGIATESISTLDNFGNLQVVQAILKGNQNIHAHLDWRNPIEWLNQPPSFLLHAGARLDGILSLAPDPAHLHWVRFFAFREGLDFSFVWKQLFPFILEHYPFTKQDRIIALCYQHWMETMLASTGWKKAHKIIVLTWEGSYPKIKSNDPRITIRKMKADDLQQVIRIDDICFSDFWKFSGTTLTLAYEQSSYATIAEIEGEIVGFQISTADLYRAHLTRLAVLPQYRSQGIGTRLVQNMLAHFSVPWIKQVTVNTQHDNQASIHLYQQAGFAYKGEFFPIYQYPLP